MAKFVLNNMYEPEDITLSDVILWIEKEFSSVWDEYVNPFKSDNYKNKFIEVVPNGVNCSCQFGSNEGIYLIIEDKRTSDRAIVGKTLDASDKSWYECCFSLARIGLELREIIW